MMRHRRSIRRRRAPYATLLCLVILLSVGAATLQAAQDPQESTEAAAQASPAERQDAADHEGGPGPEGEEEGPVPIPQPSEETLSYYRSGVIVWLNNYLAAILVSAIVLFTGLSAKMRNLAMKIGRFWPIAAVLYLIQFVIADFVIVLPFGYYAEVYRPRAYGLEDIGFGEWLVEGLLFLPGAVVFLGLLMILLYGLLRLAPRTWWLWIGLAIFPLGFISNLDVFQLPALRPMESQELAAELEELGHEAGFDRVEVYQINGDEVSVAGSFGAPKILVGEEALAELDRDKLRFVAARELGKRRLHRDVKHNFLRATLAIVVFFFLYKVASFLVERFKHVWKFDELKDIASWPLFPVLFNLLFLLLRPIDTTYTRHLEHEADRFALELTHENGAAADLYAEQSHERLLHPSPGLLYQLWRSPSPTLADRVAFANQYRPWETGEPLKYADRFGPTPDEE